MEIKPSGVQGESKPLTPEQLADLAAQGRRVSRIAALERLLEANGKLPPDDCDASYIAALREELAALSPQESDIDSCMVWSQYIQICLATIDSGECTLEQTCDMADKLELMPEVVKIQLQADIENLCAAIDRLVDELECGEGQAPPEVPVPSAHPSPAVMPKRKPQAHEYGQNPCDIAEWDEWELTQHVIKSVKSYGYATLYEIAGTVRNSDAGAIKKVVKTLTIGSGDTPLRRVGSHYTFYSADEPGEFIGRDGKPVSALKDHELLSFLKRVEAVALKLKYPAKLATILGKANYASNGVLSIHPETFQAMYDLLLQLKLAGKIDSPSPGVYGPTQKLSSKIRKAGIQPQARFRKGTVRSV